MVIAGYCCVSYYKCSKWMCGRRGTSEVILFYLNSPTNSVPAPGKLNDCLNIFSSLAQQILTFSHITGKLSQFPTLTCTEWLYDCLSVLNSEFNQQQRFPCLAMQCTDNSTLPALSFVCLCSVFPQWIFPYLAIHVRLHHKIINMQSWSS